MVVFGPEETAKSSVVADVLTTFSVRHTIINCSETISQRHLLHKTLQSCIQVAAGDTILSFDQRCEHLNTLAVRLQLILEGQEEGLVLVFDGIDKQREAGMTLLPSLARLGEMIPNLSVIFIATTTRALRLQRPGVPYIHFSPYTRVEAVTIVSRDVPSVGQDDENLSVDQARLAQWYTLFVTAVYDSLIGPTTQSLPQLQRTCLNLWPRFLQPVLRREPPAGKSKEWDFPKLFLKNKALFQADGEESLVVKIESPAELGRRESVVPKESETTFLPIAATLTPSTLEAPLLKYTPTLALMAAYLASHNSSKVDMLLFSRLSNQSTKAKRTKKSYHRKKLNFTSAGTPSKRGRGGEDEGDLDIGHEGTPVKVSSKSAGTATAEGKSAKIGKSIWSLQAKIPHPFPLDRLFAIYRAIHPQGVSTVGTSRRHQPVADNLMNGLVELARLRLVVPVVTGSSSSAGTGDGMVGDGGAAGGKWRVNVRREFVEERCKEWNIGDEGLGAIGEWEL